MIWFFLIGGGVGSLVAFLIMRGKHASLMTKIELTERELSSGKTLLAEKEARLEQMADERAALMARRDVLQAQAEALQQQMDAWGQEAAQQKNDWRTQHEQAMKQQKDEAEQQRRELQQHYEGLLAELSNRQKEQMAQQSSLIREQINSASEKILKERAEELSSSNKEQLASILNPLHENLKQMREAVEKSDRAHITTMERLDASIKANMEQAREVGARADKLAQALTSENKTQGNFGELRLRTLLKNMGLEEGVQFEEQSALRDEQGNVVHEEEHGRTLIPDVILHFPDNRDVIIDSKISLKAFEDYYNAETDEAKEQALRRHIASVKNHVRELAHKNYSHYLHAGHQKPDFVVMYVYSESALQLALTHAPSLYKDAYDEGVIISGSQNLYTMLRVLEMTWRQVRQAENQEAIMKTANELVSRVQLFYERLLVIDEQLRRTQEAFGKLKTTAGPSGPSIITAATNLLKYGAKENPKRKQRLPRADDADDTTSAQLVADSGDVALE